MRPERDSTAPPLGQLELERPGTAESPTTGGTQAVDAAVDAAELRANIARTRTVATWAVGLWTLTPLLDLLVSRLIHAAPLRELLMVRVGTWIILLGILAALRRPLDRRGFTTIRLVLFGTTSVAIALLCLCYRGLESPFLLGLPCVLVVQGTTAPTRMRHALRAMGLTTAACLAVLLVGVALAPGLRGQYTSTLSLMLFGINLLCVSIAWVLLAAGAGAYHALRRQVFAQRMVGRYRLVSRIGKGGMGEVWRARHPALGQDIAVKILRTDRTSAALIQRFEQEILALSELTHPHTVRILDSGVTDDGLCYYAMELLDGETLAARITRQGPLAPAQAMELGRQVAGALAEAHRRGLVHRDLKPENVFLTGGGASTLGFAKVIDFGIAKRLGDGATQQGQAVLGTPAYMAPEQRAGLEVDGRADVYSLGAVLAAALGPGELPEPVSALIARCLAPRREDRFASMADLEAALESVEAQLGAAPEVIASDRTAPLRAQVQRYATPLPEPAGGSAPAIEGGVSAADMEHRANLVLTRWVMFWGCVSWASTAVVDLVVSQVVPGVSLAYLWSCRLVSLAVLVALWLRSRREPMLDRKQLRWLQRAAFAAAALGIALLSRGWEGLGSPIFGGMPCVLIAYGLMVPGPLRQVATRLTINIAIWALGVVAGAMVTPGLALQLTRVESWAMFAQYVFIFGLYVVLMAAAGSAYWNLRRQLFSQRLLGRYRLRKLLGKGGMGEVWSAQQPGLAREVAIKILSAVDATPMMIKRFETEVGALRDLRHPHTVRVHDFGITDDGLWYYVMEHLDGQTLAEQLANDGPLPPARAIALARQVAGALGEAHSRGLVHRDLKPDNVFITRGAGGAKVIDFGIAKRSGDDAELTQTGTVVGTPGFMAPEQASGRFADVRSDVYALGATFFTMLTGRAPHDDDPQPVHDQPPVPSAFAPSLPRAVDALVASCMAKDPARRPQSMAEVERQLAALVPLCSELPAAARPELPADAIPTRARPDLPTLPG